MHAERRTNGQERRTKWAPFDAYSNAPKMAVTHKIASQREKEMQ